MASPSFDDICERLEIPEALRKHVAATTAERAKMAVARGLLPVPPRTLLSMQYMLLGDASPTVAAEAEKSIIDLPEDRLIPLLDRSTHPKLLEFLAYKRPRNERLLEAIALSHQVNDKTLCYLAETGSNRVCEMVAANHERLIITPQLVLFLERNQKAGQALVDRVRSFQRLYGLNLSEEKEEEAEEAADETEAVVQRAPQPEPEPAPIEEASELVGHEDTSPVWARAAVPSEVTEPPTPSSITLPEDLVPG
ncbi:MAG: hypothetical protein VX498_07375, partial [Myxococcota bacterium]|nr:hypothetical protein [Myxococcota bacterium]